MKTIIMIIMAMLLCVAAMSAQTADPTGQDRYVMYNETAPLTIFEQPAYTGPSTIDGYAVGFAKDIILPDGKPLADRLIWNEFGTKARKVRISGSAKVLYDSSNGIPAYLFGCTKGGKKYYNRLKLPEEPTVIVKKPECSNISGLTLDNAEQTGYQVTFVGGKYICKQPETPKEPECSNISGKTLDEAVSEGLDILYISGRYVCKQPETPKEPECSNIPGLTVKDALFQGYDVILLSNDIHQCQKLAPEKKKRRGRVIPTFAGVLCGAAVGFARQNLIGGIIGVTAGGVVGFKTRSVPLALLAGCVPPIFKFGGPQKREDHGTEDRGGL